MTVLRSLLEITVYSAILYAMVMLFKALFKKHASPALMYMAWFLLIARLIVPVTVDSGFSLFIIPAGQVQNVNAETSSQADATNNVPVNELDASATAADAAPVAAETTAQGQPANTGTVQQNSNGFPLDWSTALIALWITGAGFFILYFCCISARLKKRIERQSIPASPELQEMACEIREELGIQKQIRVVVLGDFASPALNCGVRPVIIVPFYMLSNEAGQIEYALRHELMHFKRKDHTVCMLVTFLRAVYWFNPVVWLMVKQIKLDMETACDSMVVKHMNSLNKKLYARTILEMYATKQDVQFILGMALGINKKTAERRIRGVFMQSRSNRNARLAASLLSLLMLIVCFTTACQPKSETAAVVGNGGLEQEIPQFPTPANTNEAPATARDSVGELRKDAVVIGTFKTDFTESTPNRTFNILKAAGLINGKTVEPGEIFDMNKTLGSRTSELGWKTANGIVDGRYELQPGVGVCQVATTLFGAILRADLEVVERKNHSFPSAYVKIGQDATISADGPNFRFKNTRSGPVYIVASADTSKGILTVTLYGPPHPKGYAVEITSELVSIFSPGPAIVTVDNSKPAGYKEEVSIYHVGKKSRTYKTYYKNGKQVGERILIYEDTYPAVRSHVIVGPAKTPAPTKTATPKPTPKPTVKPTANPS
ncbi:MAG: M56 family metallopeptidase [Bacillota bacterium]